MSRAHCNWKLRCRLWPVDYASGSCLSATDPTRCAQQGPPALILLYLHLAQRKASSFAAPHGPGRLQWPVESSSSRQRAGTRAIKPQHGAPRRYWKVLLRRMSRRSNVPARRNAHGAPFMRRARELTTPGRRRGVPVFVTKAAASTPSLRSESCMALLQLSGGRALWTEIL